MSRSKVKSAKNVAKNASKKKFRKLTEEQQASIFGKADWEGLEGYLRNYAPTDFKGTEYESKVEQVSELLKFFANLILQEFEQAAIDQDEFDDEE